MKHATLEHEQLRKLVHYTNSQLTLLTDVLKESTSVPFGVKLGLPHVNVEFALQRHRVLSKFQVPNKDSRNALWDQCMDSWLDHEDHLATFDLYGKLHDSGPHVRSVIYRAKNWISETLKSHKFKISLLDVDLDFTPGATFIPSKGKTSVRQKLKDLQHWTVTWEAIPDALELIWNTNALRHMALGHLTTMHILENNTETYWLLWHHKEAFKSLVELHLLTPVNGARAAAVPKNNEKMRFINIEPMFNMLLQRCVASELKRIMKIIGNDLEVGQQDHRNMISNLTVATMDLRNASDSNHYAGSEFMAPTKLWSYLSKWRSYTTTLNYKEAGRPDLECVNYKLSSMGNGFTFEWMTLYLLSICRQLDPHARVYGDDIIVLAEHADTVRLCLETLGWEINPDKTFTTGLFRESCGAFFHSDVGYITSYDISFCENIQDVVITCNKLRRVMHYHPALQNTWTQIIERVPALLKGPINLGSLNQQWIETSSFERAHKSSKACNKRYKRRYNLLQTAESLWQKKALCVVTSFVFKSLRVFSAQSEVWESADVGFYLYSLRKTDDVLRGKGRWRAVDLVVFNDGSFCRVSEIRRVRQGIKNAMRARSLRSSLEFKLEKFVTEYGREYALAA